MYSCVVYNCTNNSLTSDRSVHYYSFPKNNFTQQWIQACGWQSNLIDLDAARICSIHFDESAYNTETNMVDFPARYSEALRYDAVPKLYLPQTKIIINDNPLDPNDIKNFVVFTVHSTSSDGITTYCLPDAGLTKQFFQGQPPMPDIKLEVQSDPVKIEVIDNAVVPYSDIRTYPDLYVLRAKNKSLKKKNEALEKKIRDLEQILNTSENEHVKLEKQRQILQAQKRNKNMSLQEQKRLLRKVFSEAQIKMLFGKKLVYWNQDDNAVAYTIRHLSNKKCYAYLTKTLNIPLPGLSSIRRWVAARKIKGPQNIKKGQDGIV